MKYNRNWSYEQNATVYFVDGHSEQLFCRTDNKGQIEYVVYDGTNYTPDQFDGLGIWTVHFMTPARLEIKNSVEQLVEAYLDLGKRISEGDKYDTAARVSRRACIAAELHKRGVNIHHAMTGHSE